MAAVTLTGLDIGSTFVRAIETSRRRDETAIVNFGQVELPPGAVKGGRVIDGDAVTAAIKKLWTVRKLKNRSVVLGVMSRQIVVREMSLPNLPPRELRETLPFQVGDVLPIPVENALLDFLPMADPGTGPKVRGLLIAAPKEAVIDMVRAVERAGLRVVKVDLASFAILRSSARLSANVEAIVDIGAYATNVVVHADGEPRIVRTVPRGGAAITELLSSRLQISLAEAEALKCSYGLTPHDGVKVGAHSVGQDVDAANQGTGAGDSEAVQIIREAIRPLVNEIRSSLAYVRQSGAQTPVASLALCGGGAMLPGLVDTLSSDLGIEVFLADPLQRLNEGRSRKNYSAFAQYRSSAAVSVGLALGAA